MDLHAGSTAIVCATANLARAFYISTTAEGVETEDQYRALRAAGVTKLQGYLFGRPAPETASEPCGSPSLTICRGEAA